MARYSRRLAILFFVVIAAPIIGAACYCACLFSSQQVQFFLQTSPSVLYKTLSSPQPWEGFLEAGRKAVPLRCHDQTTDLNKNMACVIVMNHPWNIRWWCSDQFALGSLPRFLTRNMKIISEKSSQWNPRTIVLNKLDKSRNIFVHKGAKNQYHSMEKAVQSIKDSKSTLLVYPEGSHSHMYKYRDSPPTLAPFKTGIFRAIYAVDVPVTPVVLPLEWTPEGESTVAIEILPLIYPTAYASAEAFTSGIYDVMLRRLTNNKTKNRVFGGRSPHSVRIAT